MNRVDNEWKRIILSGSVLAGDMRVITVVRNCFAGYSLVDTPRTGSVRMPDPATISYSKIELKRHFDVG